MSALSLDDAKLHLNITAADNDVELQGFIDAAEGVVAARCGPLQPETVTRRVWSDGRAIVLPVVPVVSLTSITLANGTTSDLTALYVDDYSGVVSWNSAWSSWFSPGYYDLVYVAGRLTVPDDLLMAVKEMVRHLWRTQRGGTTRPGSTPDQVTPGYLVPNLVAELMEPHVQTLGFA